MSYAIGQKDERPWGTWEILDVGANHAVKRIVVKPQQRLSLQRHQMRSEVWIIVRGEAEVTCGHMASTMLAGETVTIERGQMHRVTNLGHEDLEFIEIQCGTCDESDIERFEDDYGRVAA